MPFLAHPHVSVLQTYHCIVLVKISTENFSKWNEICDRICEKVPFSHIKFDPFFQLSNFVTFVSLQAHVCNFP